MEALLANGKPAIFIGHSLGGALATYAAMRAHWAQKKVLAVYTFASPRVGNTRWAKVYNPILGQRTFRFANRHDLVTRLPFRGLSEAMLDQSRYDRDSPAEAIAGLPARWGADRVYSAAEFGLGFAHA